MVRRRRNGYFPRLETGPAPLVGRVPRRVNFREADVMGIAWYGHYPAYFEEGAAAVCGQGGLSYEDFFRAGLRAPIAQCHIDYHAPLRLGEAFTIEAALFWNEAARLDIEYRLLRADGCVAATGYTVQLFIEAATGAVCAASPELLERCRTRWKAGEFRHLQ